MSTARVQPMSRNRGFTLLEVVIALALAGTIAVLAHRSFAAVIEVTQAAHEARRALDTEMNAARWLAEALGSLEVGGDAGGFAGGPESVEFGTWLPAVAGGPERRRAAIVARRDTLWLRAQYDMPLLDRVRAVGFDYLLEPGAREVWVREWISPVSAPVAVRIRVRRPGGTDTLLLVVGSRG